MAPSRPEPRNKAMELGPRDRLSQAFWHESQKGRTFDTPGGDAVYLDLRHLGAAKLKERLPLICDMAKEFMDIDPATGQIPVRPAVHYTMGGIPTDIRTATSLPGLFAAGECSSVGIHGANRLGSNSLAELFVFGHVAGDEAVKFSRNASAAQSGKLIEQAKASAAKVLALRDQKGGGERHANLRKEMAATMEKGCGIYRTAPEMQATCDKLAELRRRFGDVTVEDRSNVWNTDWIAAVELGYQLEVAETVAHSALMRKESRGAHQRLDGYESRDDAKYLGHSLAHYREGAAPEISYGPVKITRLQPAVRAYGALGEALEKEAMKDVAHV